MHAKYMNITRMLSLLLSALGYVYGLGLELNAVVGAAVAAMLARAADDLLPSGAATPAGWKHRGAAALSPHAISLALEQHHKKATSKAAAAAATAAAELADAELEFEPPADLVRLLADRLAVELFALRNQVAILEAFFATRKAPS